MNITSTGGFDSRVRRMGSSQPVSRKDFFFGASATLGHANSGDPACDFDFDEPLNDNDSETEKFRCLALQHHTRDYLATLDSDPRQVIYVHVHDEHQYGTGAFDSQASLVSSSIAATKRNALAKASHANQTGERTMVKHFTEDVSRIEILPEARYTLICLQTAIYVYSRNSTYLYDIVACSEASISSAIYRFYEQKLVLAYLSQADSSETVEVHDYSVSKRTGMDTVYTMAKPFSAGYKVGGVQLDELG